MFAKTYSFGTRGLDGFLVTAEVDISGGLPQMTVVGLPDSAVKEASDRVRSALKNLGFTYPVGRITINLAPADKRKTGSVYDLPMLLGILAAGKQIPQPEADSAFVGELGLAGEVRPVGGVLAMAQACKDCGIHHFFVPEGNAAEAALVDDINVYPVAQAQQVLSHLEGRACLDPMPTIQGGDGVAAGLMPDFSEVHGQLEARRALEVAAVGMHNLLLVGVPGAGKSMLAKRLPGLLLPLSRDQAIETETVYSAAGLVRSGEGQLDLTRPFRSPHHGASAVSLAGGGTPVKPGEVSLAHNGVLFLDELPEFKREALEVLRQPLEDGAITVSRAAGSITYPSRFMLVAAMNPCPCGYFGHPTRECRCLGTAIDRYLHKVSGPLLDRIDLHITVQPVDYEDISARQGGESSADIRRRVLKARDFQRRRSGRKGWNADLEGEALRTECRMTGRAQDLLRRAFEKMGLSARGYDRVLKVSRTIADMDEAEIIDTIHVSEAVQYRNMDRKYYHIR